jgi:hypothetical protein
MVLRMGVSVPVVCLSVVCVDAARVASATRINSFWQQVNVAEVAADLRVQAEGLVPGLAGYLPVDVIQVRAEHPGAD